MFVIPASASCLKAELQTLRVLIRSNITSLVNHQAIRIAKASLQAFGVQSFEIVYGDY